MKLVKEFVPAKPFKLSEDSELAKMHRAYAEIRDGFRHTHWRERNMRTTVVHSNVVPAGPGTVYIGRPGPWGNPYVLGPDGNRDEVIKQFSAWLGYSDDPRAVWMRVNIRSLEGKVLRCHCHPLPCHGDTLVHFLRDTLEEA